MLKFDKFQTEIILNSLLSRDDYFDEKQKTRAKGKWILHPPGGLSEEDSWEQKELQKIISIFKEYLEICPDI